MDLVTLCPPSRQTLSSRAQLALAGLTRRGLQDAVARGQLVRVARGVYAPGPLPPRAKHLMSGGTLDPAYLAEVRASLLSAPDACAGGRTAALLWGWDLAVEPQAVELALASGARAPAGCVGVEHEERDVVERRVSGFDPVRLTSALQTVFHCAVQLPLAEAVVIADSALRAQTLTLPELVALWKAHRGRPGGRRLRRVVQLCDPRSGSVLESLFRVLLAEAGLLKPVAQAVMYDGKKAIGRVDFVWPDIRLVVECDGRRWHDPQDARDNDRRRDNALTLTSWRVLRYSWADVVHDGARVVEEVRRALEGFLAA